jgi:hypothetical protein
MKVPTLSQQLLLKAVLRAGSESLDALAQWQAITTFKTLDTESTWLLPLLFSVLRQRTIPNPQMPAYGAVYRHNWYKNHLLLINVSKILKPFSDMNIPVVWLKGAATALVYYTDFGARPINHFDCWIPKCWRDFISERLSTYNWSAVNMTDCFDLYEDDLGRQIYIWWALFNAQVDHAFQDRLRTFRGKYAPFYFLDPRDQLIQLCAYRNNWDQRSSLLWIVDSAHLLSHLGSAADQMLKNRLIALELPPSLVESLAIVREIWI